MQKINKIFWRIGQEITPETFIQADNYICSQHNLIRRLIANNNYGLLPQIEPDTPSLTVKINLNNRDIYVENLVCCGATDAGYLIEFESRMLASLPQKSLTIPDSDAKALYMVLRSNPFEQVLIEPVMNEETPMAHAAYEFAIKELDQIKEDELAILKIDTGNYSPVIDQAYIPPCMSVDACSKLLETYGMLKQLVTEILSHIEHKGELFGASLYPLHMLRNELDDFPLSSQPDALIRFMKRIIQTFRFFIPNIRTVDMPDLLRTYNHNDMSLTFKSLLSYLHHVSRIVSQGIEEDFTPRI